MHPQYTNQGQPSMMEHPINHQMSPPHQQPPQQQMINQQNHYHAQQAQMQPQQSMVMHPQSGSPPQPGQPSQQQLDPQGGQTCIRHGCRNPAIVNSDWEDEYCSNECVITHCRLVSH